MGQETGRDSANSETGLATVDKPPPPLPVRMLVSGTMTGIGLICVLYLTNLTGGWVEIIPDGIPVIGNMDEAGATAGLLMVLSYWGFDVTQMGRWIGQWQSGRKALPATTGKGASGRHD